MKRAAQGRSAIAAAGAAIAGLAWGAMPAAAEPGRLADFALALSTRSPAAPTGLTVHVRFHREDDPEAKPSPIRTAVLELPPGLRFDTSVVPECTASDEELRALGPDACPDESELTVGSLVGVTGFGAPFDPLVGDNHVFNGPNQLIEVIASPGTSASPAFDRLTIAGSTLTAHPPVTPGGPPDGETAVRSIDFQIPVRSAAGRSLITAPPGCPEGERWTSAGTFGFADGSTDTVVSTTPCSPAAAATPPRLRLRARPRRVRAGHVVRLRFRVRASEPSCVAGASVRIGRRSARPDPSGRARIAIEFHRPGLRRARVTSPGCARAHARIRVLPRRR